MSATKVAKSATRANVRIEIEHAGVTDPVELLAQLGLDLRCIATQAGNTRSSGVDRCGSRAKLAGLATHIGPRSIGGGTERLCAHGRTEGCRRSAHACAQEDRPGGTASDVRAFQQPEPQRDTVYQRLDRWIVHQDATQQTVDDVIEGYGASRSAVSRRW